MRQFNVESCHRYQPHELEPLRVQTWCNVFVWDVTLALHAEIPHWIDEEADPCPPGQGKELSANGVIGWLLDHGRRHGWESSSVEKARHCANAGMPVVASWANNGGHGHLAIVLPSPPLPDQLRIIQAGAVCGEGSISWGFGRHVDDVTLWVHA